MRRDAKDRAWLEPSMSRSRDHLATLCALLLWGSAAVLGWRKLPLGLGLGDEGMYLVDGWRLTVGDRLFPDASTNAVQLYSLFNGAIFAAFPGLDLLDMRRLAFVVSQLGLGAMVLALRIWGVPVALTVIGCALIGYTGLDVNGMSASLSYYSTPHLFLALYVLGLSAGLHSAPAGRTRLGLMLGAGASLALVGFALMPLVAGIVHLPLLWWLCRGHADARLRLSRSDVFALLAPTIVLWVTLLALFRGELIRGTLDVLRYATTGPEHPSRAGAAAVYAAIAFLTLVGVLRARAIQGRGRRNLATGAALVGSIAVVDTNGFGLMPHYWNDWFDAPLWWAALMAVGAALTLSACLWPARRSGRVSRVELPGTLLALVGGAYGSLLAGCSTLGLLCFGHVTLLLAPCIALLLSRRPAPLGEARPGSLATAAVFLLAYAWPVALHDYRFTNFDRAPARLDTTIADGFAAGIRTNAAFAALDGWLRRQTEAHSVPGDLALVFDQVPMVHLLIQRRPALNHSWVGLGRSNALRAEAVERAIACGRRPAIAFRFLVLGLYWPLDLGGGESLPPPPHTFPREDPVDAYVLGNMRKVDTFYGDGRPWVECWVAETSAR